jgi:aminoglycoside phosphotransferase (APT) family kinase protein
MVTFTNEPKFSTHEVDKKFNERRRILVPVVKEWIESHDLFKEGETVVSFFHTGVSSLVCLLEKGAEKYVLKIPLSVLDSRQEGTFLKVWESVGVKVPHVFDEGVIGDFYFTLMEHVDSSSLGAKFSKEDLLNQEVYKEMGKVLRKMHEPKTKGFSNIVNDKSKPEYQDIDSWINGDKRLQDQITYVKENNILNDIEHGSIDHALDIITNKLKDNSTSVYCHNDYNVNNIFATEPITVFDPWPCFHHPFMDLSRAIVISQISIEGTDEQLISGYFDGGDFDRQLLQAFIFLNIVAKLKYQTETNNFAGANNFKEYLKKTKQYL